MTGIMALGRETLGMACPRIACPRIASLSLSIH